MKKIKQMNSQVLDLDSVDLILSSASQWGGQCQPGLPWLGLLSKGCWDEGRGGPGAWGLQEAPLQRQVSGQTNKNAKMGNSLKFFTVCREKNRHIEKKTIFQMTQDLQTQKLLRIVRVSFFIALTNLISKGLRPGDNGMTQQVKGLSMLDSLSLIPRTHIEVKFDNQCHKVVPWPARVHHGTCPSTHTHIHAHHPNKNNLKMFK